MRHDAERRAQRNDQFHDIWKRNGVNQHGMHVSKYMDVDKEVLAYKRLTDDLNQQLANETNLRRQAERRNRLTDYTIVRSDNRLATTIDVLNTLERSTMSSLQIPQINIRSDDHFMKAKKALKDSLNIHLNSSAQIL